MPRKISSFSSKVRAHAFVLASVAAFAHAMPARADGDAGGLARTNACTIVNEKDAGGILGFNVAAPDSKTQTAGICTFATVSATQDGVLSYSVVTLPDVLARAPYFRRLAFRCGNVDPHALNAVQCATYRKLAVATTVAAYYEGRVGTPDAVPQTGLGDEAVANATAVFVLRGGEVLECVVRRGDSLDTDRSVALATLLLARVAPLAGPAPVAPSSPA